jgi:hypothetical protein
VAPANAFSTTGRVTGAAGRRCPSQRRDTHGNDVLTSVHDQHAVQEFAPYRLGDLLSYQGPARSVAMPNR